MDAKAAFDRLNGQTWTREQDEVCLSGYFFCVFKVKVLICLISYNTRFLKVHIPISQKSLERICEASLSRPSTLCLEYQAQN